MARLESQSEGGAVWNLPSCSDHVNTGPARLIRIEGAVLGTPSSCLDHVIFVLKNFGWSPLKGAPNGFHLTDFCPVQNTLYLCNSGGHAGCHARVYDIHGIAHRGRTATVNRYVN